MSRTEGVQGPDQSKLRANIERCLLGVLENPPEAVDWNKPFREYGLDSMAAVGFAADLEDALQIPISATAFWDHPTLAELATFLETELQSSDTRPKQ